LVVAACGGEEDTPYGAAGEACYSNDTCQDGLICAVGYCITEVSEDASSTPQADAQIDAADVPAEALDSADSAGLGDETSGSDLLPDPDGVINEDGSNLEDIPRPQDIAGPEEVASLNDNGGVDDTTSSGQGGETDDGAGTTPACSPESAGTGLEDAESPLFSVAVESPSPFLTDLKSKGFQFYPDGNLTVLSGPEGLEVFLPVGTLTMRLVGPTLDGLVVSPSGPILAPSGDINTPHQGYAGANTVLDCSGSRYAFFHGENHAVTGLPTPPASAPPYHATMNRATALAGSTDFLVDASPSILSSAGAPSYSLPKIAYGAGGGTIFNPGSDYLYLYYFDWDGPQGIHLARACKAECGAAGTWRKWTGAGFASPAMPEQLLAPSGPSEALVPVSPGTFDAFSSISFNTYLNAYLMVSATEAGITMRVSGNGIQWGARVPVLEFVESEDATLGQFYPTLLDAETLSRDITGRFALLVYGWQADTLGQVAPHTAWSATLELVRSEDAQITGADLLSLVRHYNAATGDHWVTTQDAGPGYAVEAVLGQVPANSIEGTHPVYDCDSGGDHLASRFTNCEGGASAGIMGFAWSTPAPDRKPIYRCFSGLGAALDHFVSLDPACEGASSEGVLGYVK